MPDSTERTVYHVDMSQADRVAAEMLQAHRDQQDALVMALCTATAIPERMMVPGMPSTTRELGMPNLNGRVYPQDLLTRQFRRFAERMREQYIEMLRRDEWPGRFEHAETPGAVHWGRNWFKPVAAVDWSPPDIKPPSRWSSELKSIWGVRGDIVPISEKPLPKNEQTTLSQGRHGSPIGPGSAQIPTRPRHAYFAITAALTARQRRYEARAALRYDRRSQAGQDDAGQGDRPAPVG